MENLKNYDKKLYIFIFANLLIFYILNNNFNNIIEYKNLISFIAIPLLSLAIFLINSIIPREMKFFILYFYKKKHRFASNIFTRLKNKDIKYNEELIDIDLLLKKYKNKIGEDEDALWYEIYFEHKYDEKIYQQNREFLFIRDFTILIIPFTVLFFIINYTLKIPSQNSLLILIIAFIEFFICRMIAIKNNKRLVLSVLQEESYIIKKNKI